MATREMNQLRSELDQSGAQTALVRGTYAPPRPPETVTVEPGVVATVGPAGRSAPLYVTAEATSGRTIRRYDGRNAGAAADRAAELAAERDPRAVWLCERGQIRSWWGVGIADLLERRLATAARRADARLVVWTDDGDESVAAVEDDEAVEDRYDVVVGP
ncbi:hypothetical protein [Halorussus sp. MSC15.2]|uniref:hypothetical protein n=1 Tax=Halorussus sp. MSC15.2 TaxID=2283638 RepID=UPI0013D12158|nr:hypothetical protein [Halorussus sp. MSC15.2]NEU56117.1 hypothetical protein [Halorussus sp. MSC15.2]